MDIFKTFRIYKGVAKYTSDFVVPSTSPDILPDTPSGVVGGSKLAKITDGAVSFDGNGDYLSTLLIIQILNMAQVILLLNVLFYLDHTSSSTNNWYFKARWGSEW